MELKRWLTLQADRVGALVALVVGALALWAGYRGISDAIYPGQQLPYVISGGLVGLFLIGLAAALWLSADLKDEWRKLDEVNTNLLELIELARSDGGPARMPGARPPEAADLVVDGPSSNGGRRRTLQAR